MLDALEKFEQYDLVEVIEDVAKFKKLQNEIGVWRDDLEEVKLKVSQNLSTSFVSFFSHMCNVVRILIRLGSCGPLFAIIE